MVTRFAKSSVNARLSACARQTYAALNALAGHYNSFGTASPLPKKRLERLRKVRACLQLRRCRQALCMQCRRRRTGVQASNVVMRVHRQELEDAEKYLGRGR